ncbi:MAG: hypothetical protein F6J87_18335 [Spirulina sp. SIO3F2]|nr:hypothetical protein [Spirulina sp. SIO3F2]
MPRNYGPATLVSVNMNYGGGPLRYAFKTRVQLASTRTALGHTAIDTSALADVQNLVFGCNSPKPARAQKITTGAAGSESSFCSDANIPALRGDGWRITPRKAGRRPCSTPRSFTAYVTINGVKYAWCFSRLPSTLSGVTITETGLTEAAPDEEGLVWGCSFPKPPKVGREVEDTEDSSTDFLCTFADPSALSSAITAGWEQVNAKGTNLTTVDDFRSLVG